MLQACTIVARNYLPYARVLAESFFAHHPSGSFTILLIDDERRQQGSGGEDRITWKRLTDVGLDTAEIRRLAAIYDVTELATAVKPMLLRRMLEDGCGEVVYLDPDICVYDSLFEVAALARQHGIVLTPHTMRPFPRDDRDVDGHFILSAGIYNLGFIAVGRASVPFLEWWWQSTRREALMDVAKMMFTDQRVVDFVPSFFHPHLLKDPGCNVAYWNLHGREVTAEGDRWLVDGRALRFFHFSGYDPDRPWLLSRNQGSRPRILLSERPAVRSLCRDYGARLAAARRDAGNEGRYGWGHLPSGAAITTRMRRLYRSALLAAERTGTPQPPNPFDESAPDAFIAWLNGPAERGPRVLSRYLHSIYLDRVDLQVHFPDIHGADAPRFLDWLWQVGIAPEILPPELLPLATGPQAGAEREGLSALRHGVNLAGYFRAELGIGEAARLLAIALADAGIPHATTIYSATLSRQEHAYEERSDSGAAYDVNVICVNADSTPQFAGDMGPAFFAGRHTVGYWFWEIEQLPAAMHAAFDVVDEVWTATEFVAASIRRVSRKPVFTVPLPLPAAIPSSTPSPVCARYGLGDRFAFLQIFDFLSVFARKNPLGTVEAFRHAFEVGEGPVLILKSINGHLRLRDLERLRAAAEDRPDIQVIDEYSSADERNALLEACDCYVSLHRSEGLGLTLAEAMAAGKPAIATGYSGNLHFMTAENSYLVDHVPIAIPPGCDPYPESATWAEPDLDQAARFMREVFERPADAAVRAARGRSDILTRHSAAISGTAVAARLRAIRADRESRLAVPHAHVPKETSMSLDSPPPPGTTIGEPIEALLPHLESLAAPRISPGGGALGGIRHAAQRILFRILRPYWFQQYQLNKYVIAAFGRVAGAMRYDEQRHEALDRRVRELTGELAECRRELRRLEGAVADPGGLPRPD